MEHQIRDDQRKTPPTGENRPPQRPQPPPTTPENGAAAQPYFIAQEVQPSGAMPAPAAAGAARSMPAFSDFVPAQAGEGAKPAKPAVKLLWSAAVFGALFALLFVKQSAGLNVMLLVLMTYGFAAVNRDLFVAKSWRDAPVAYALTLPAAALSVLVFTGSSGINALCIAAIAGILFLQYLVISGTALHDWDRPAILIDAALVGINKWLLGMGQFVSGVFGRLFKKEGHKKGIVIGILSGAALLAIVVPVLSAADAQAQRMLQEFFAGWDAGDVFLYLFAFLAGASLISGPVALARRGEFTGARKPLVSQGKRPMPAAATAIALSMLAIVYVLFAALQISYLFAPADTVAQVMGLSRSAYAVRGFGEMIAVSLLNFVLVGLALRFSKQTSGGLRVFEKALVTLLIVFNFVILASANVRMSYYEAAFGFTVARMLSHSFMIFTAVVNAMVLVRIYVKFRAVKLVIALCAVYLTVVAAVNPERFVTRRNIERYETTQRIDAQYLIRLPGDAKAEICEFLQQHPQEITDEVLLAAGSELDRYLARTEKTGWQSTNIAELRAAKALQELAD